VAILDFESPYLPNLPTLFWQTLNLDSPHIEVEKKVGLNKSLGGGVSVSRPGTILCLELQPFKTLAYFSKLPLF